MLEILSLDNYIFYLIAAGFITLLAAIIPNVFRKQHITAPILYLVIGLLLYISFSNYFSLGVLNNVDLILKISEFVVIVSLTNAGLKITKPFRWKTWKYSFWLLAITMPLTIIAAGYTSYWILGFAPAAAVLFGAIIAPTDPVLAADLQTSQPSERDKSKVRVGLTSEAGLNDGLAFPFTYFAIFLVTKGFDYSTWIVDWMLMEVFYKLVVGVLMGWLCGWLLYRLIFSITNKDHRAPITKGILSLALTLLPYGLTEFLGGYGFIAVFIAACVFSDREHHSSYMDKLHDFTEEIERIFVALLFVVMGVYIASDYSDIFTWDVILTAGILLFIIRPLAGWIALSRTDLKGFEKFVLSFYGIRGIGSVYYLMYALSKAEFPNAEKLVHITTVTIVLSVLIHGVSAATIQKRLERIDHD